MSILGKSISLVSFLKNFLPCSLYEKDRAKLTKIAFIKILHHH